MNGMNPVLTETLTEYLWTGNASQFTNGIAGLFQLSWTHHQDDFNL
jgi:hypothetical protein